MDGTKTGEGCTHRTSRSIRGSCTSILPCRQTSRARKNPTSTEGLVSAALTERPRVPDIRRPTSATAGVRVGVASGGLVWVLEGDEMSRSRASSEGVESQAVYVGLQTFRRRGRRECVIEVRLIARKLAPSS